MKTLRRRYARRHPDRTPAGFVHPAIAKLFAARPVLPRSGFRQKAGNMGGALPSRRYYFAALRRAAK